MGTGIPAIVAAGDRGAARAVCGESKAFLELAGLPLVAWVVLELQRVPEVSEVWVIGDAERLDALLGAAAVQEGLAKPLHVVAQFANLYENAWEGYRRVLPGAGAGGRDPASPDDEAWPVLYVSGDLPFATAHEISDFVRRGLELGCDYALGLSTEESFRDFLPAAGGGDGIEIATFNLREGRFRQNNLHLARPARIGNRVYIEEMYANRHQRELGQILRLAWTLFTEERGGLAVVWYYGLMHWAGLADRRGWRRLADAIRRFAPLERIARGCSGLLKTDFRFVITEVGGCAVDIDTEADYAVAQERFDEWRAAQRRRAEAVIGPLLPPTSGSGSEA